MVHGVTSIGGSRYRGRIVGFDKRLACFGKDIRRATKSTSPSAKSSAARRRNSVYCARAVWTCQSGSEADLHVFPRPVLLGLSALRTGWLRASGRGAGAGARVLAAGAWGG